MLRSCPNTGTSADDSYIPPNLNMRHLTNRHGNPSRPPLGVYLVNRFFVRDVLEIRTPWWITATAYLFSYPVFFATSIFLQNLRIYIKSRSMGGVMPPMAEYKLPGAFDIIAIFRKTARTIYPGDMFSENAKKYGNTFNWRLLFKDRIFTTKSQYIKTVLSSDFDSYEKGKAFQKSFDALLGTGIFAADGNIWKFHRGIARPFFSKDRISDFDIFDRHAEDAIHQMKNRFKDGYAVDIQDVLSRFTLDSATEFLFGNDVHSLSAGISYPPSVQVATKGEAHPADKFATAFLNAQVVAFARGKWDDNWPLFEFWEDKLVNEMKVVSEYVDPIVEKALQSKRASAGAGAEEGNSFLDHLVKLSDDAKLIKDETLNMMTAGRDTTAATLTFLVATLLQHPQVIRRLREEILNKVGQSARPTFDDLRDMKYLRAVINETLRLFPAVPFNIRYSKKDNFWPSTTGGQPWFVPGGSRILYSVFLMHRRKDLWGPDALEFDPDRFLDERVTKYLTPNPFIFMPFNAGPRICIGQQFAYNEMSLLIIRLLQSFSEITWDVDACPEAIPPPEWASSADPRQRNERAWLKSHLTMYAQNGFWVKMKEADQHKFRFKHSLYGNLSNFSTPVR